MRGAKNMKNIEEIIMERILFIGEKYPEEAANTIRPKFVLLGTPQELIDELKENLKRARIKK